MKCRTHWQAIQIRVDSSHLVCTILNSSFINLLTHTIPTADSTSNAVNISIELERHQAKDKGKGKEVNPPENTVDSRVLIRSPSTAGTTRDERIKFLRDLGSSNPQWSALITKLEDHLVRGNFFVQCLQLNSPYSALKNGNQLVLAGSPGSTLVGIFQKTIIVAMSHT